MDTIQLKYFITVAECLNFTKAAQLTYTTQPNISKQIALLERELGFRLFHRTKQSVVLTEAGKLFYAETKNIIKQLTEARKKAAEISKKELYKLKIGVSTYLDTGAINKAIKRFEHKYPQSSVFIESVYFGTLRSRAIQGDYDIAVSLDFLFAGLKDFHSLTISRNQMYLICSKAHPAANKPGATVADFKNDLFFVLESTETPKGTELILSICNHYGFTPRTKMCNSLDSYLVNVELNYGVAIMDTSQHLPSKCYDTMAFIEVPLEIASTEVVAVWNANNNNPAIPLLINELAVQPGHPVVINRKAATTT